MRRIDPQPDAAPFDGRSLAGEEIFNRGDMTPLAGCPDLNVAERKPEFMRVARQRDGADNRVGPIDRFLDEAGNVAVIDGEETQQARLLQRRVRPPGTVELADIGLDVAGSIPVPHLDLIFLGIEIFFAAGNRLVLQQFEAVVDAVGTRKRRGERRRHPKAWRQAPRGI